MATVRIVAGLLVLVSLSGPAGVEAGAVRLVLTDADTGRTILSQPLEDSERAVLTWTNSLFHLTVTEVFVAHPGRLELDSVTFADPTGAPAPRVRPEQLDELYHTGGPFHVEGIARPVGRVVFRVGQIGHPVLQVSDRSIRFFDEVGFGGAIVMEVK